MHDKALRIQGMLENIYCLCKVAHFENVALAVSTVLLF